MVSQLICTELSLNCNLLLPFNNKPALGTWVKLTSRPAPKFNTAFSDNNDKSSPIFTSAPIPKPPAIVKAPLVTVEDAVVAEIFTVREPELEPSIISPAAFKFN